MRHILLSLALVAGLAAAARADTAAAIRTAAEQGDAQAQFALGTMYRDGQGVVQDYTQALLWWRKAAELGVIDAQLALGNIHAGGTGVARDHVQAYMWFHIVTQQSEDAWLRGIAGSNRDALAARMTSAEVSKAEGLAAEWQAKHGR